LALQFLAFVLNPRFGRESVTGGPTWGHQQIRLGPRPIVDQLYDNVPTLKSTVVCHNSLRVVSPGVQRRKSTRKDPVKESSDVCGNSGRGHKKKIRVRKELLPRTKVHVFDQIAEEQGGVRGRRERHVCCSLTHLRSPAVSLSRVLLLGCEYALVRRCVNSRARGGGWVITAGAGE
jgi:hypothetical protein